MEGAPALDSPSSKEGGFLCFVGAGSKEKTTCRSNFWPQAGAWEEQFRQVATCGETW